MRRCALFTLWILTIAVPSYAAPHAAPQLPALLPVECDRLIELLLATTAPDDRRRVAEALVDMTSHTQCLADAMMQRAAFPSFLRLLETLRTDKQSGASAGTGGSTNLVSKGTTAKILSVAAEYGALTETVNKQLVTVQGSADAIPATLIRHNLVRYCPTRGTPDCASSTLIQTLQRFSYAVSFDTGASAQIVSGTPSTSAGGTALPAIFSADNHSVTAVAVRAVLVNARDKVSQSYQEAWRERVLKSPGALNEAARRLLQSAGGFLTLVIDDPGYGPWQAETVRLLLAAPRDQIQKVWDARLQALVELLRPRHPDLQERAADAVAAFRAFRFEEDAVVLTLQKPVATLQYVYNRPLNQPMTSTLRFVVDKGLAGRLVVHGQWRRRGVPRPAVQLCSRPRLRPRCAGRPAVPEGSGNGESARCGGACRDVLLPVSAQAGDPEPHAGDLVSRHQLRWPAGHRDAGLRHER